MREQSKGRYEMLWDCEFCGTQKHLGLTHRYCPNCGAPQDPARRYFPADEDKIAVEDHPYVGVDKQCPACESPVAASCTFCGHCGSPLDQASEVAVRKAQEAKSGRFDADSLPGAQAEHTGTEPAPAPRTRGSRRWIILLVVAAVVIALVYTMCFWKRSTTLAVTGHSWERAVDIEELREVRETAWSDQLPRGAARVSCSREQRTTRQVPDGERCSMKRVDKGDGTFEEVEKCVPKYRDEPVMDNRCSYVVQRWRVVDTARASGAAGTSAEPTWPAVQVRGGSGLGAQREGQRRATYTLHVKDKDGKAHSCSVAEATWKRFTASTALTGEISRATGSLDCDSLAPAGQ